MAETKKPNKQITTILTVIASAIILWLFLQSSIGAKFLDKLKNAFAGNSETAGNTVVNNSGDSSWLDDIMRALDNAGGVFNINIPAITGYEPRDYNFPGSGSSDYERPVFDSSESTNNNTLSGCSFCMKTPEGLPPAGNPAPAPMPMIISSPPRPVTSWVGVINNAPVNTRNYFPSTGLGNFNPW